MPPRTTAEIAKSAVRRLNAEKRFSIAAAATQAGVSASSMWHYVKGERPLTLDVLEVISRLSGAPMAELVAPPDAVLKQLDADEAALLRAVRAWLADGRPELVNENSGPALLLGPRGRRLDPRQART
ncbi:MAG: helix-turn-helix domain-containing protein, partial [Rhodanobacter sp.]